MRLHYDTTIVLRKALNDSASKIPIQYWMAQSLLLHHQLKEGTHP